MAAQVATKGERSALLAKLLLTIDGLDIENPNIPKFIKELDKASYESSVENEQSTLNDEIEEEVRLSLEELNEFSCAWTKFKRKGLGDSLTAFKCLGSKVLSDHDIDGGLTLSTVHTMKGLEKDIVFLIGMCEGVFPDYRAKIAAKELEEEEKNAFVAVTRARRWLYMSYLAQNDALG